MELENTMNDLTEILQKLDRIDFEMSEYYNSKVFESGNELIYGIGRLNNSIMKKTLIWK